MKKSKQITEALENPKRKNNRIRKGGQLKGTKHRGELIAYYELLWFVFKKDLRKSDLKEKLHTDGRFMKKAMARLLKARYIRKKDNTKHCKYGITELGIEFMVYLKELL